MPDTAVPSATRTGPTPQHSAWPLPRWANGRCRRTCAGSAGLGQCEIFHQDIVYPHRRVLIAADDAHGHGQLLQPLPQPEASHGATAAQRPLDGVADDVGLECLAKLLWDMWSVRCYIFRTPPAGKLLPNLLLPVLG